mmetsp:Transcript_24010/g.78157  ORF Transcript_24010/g.78157 Transcript_24010/m.78157 type:complete len:343 (+) Transcript_24010:668-1696(+)
MLRSSIKTRRRFPIGGPYVSLVRFSTEASSERCTSIEVVRDEKLMLSKLFVWPSRLPRYCAMVTVLAVPLSPTRSTARPWSMMVCTSHVVRTVSTVGTMMEAKRPSFGGTYAGTIDFHVFQRKSSIEKLYSYRLFTGSCDAATVSESIVPSAARFLRNLSNRSRSFVTLFCTTHAPSDHTMQKMNTASKVCGSETLRSSVKMASSIVHSCVTMLRFVIGMVWRNRRVIWSSSIPSKMKSTHGVTYLSNNERSTSASCSFVRPLHHVEMNGLYPRLRLSTYTIPHRETVAGEAYCKSKTSNNSLQWSINRMRSPFGRVSSLLSSITLFMFSTHTASTSPSKTT